MKKEIAELRAVHEDVVNRLERIESNLFVATKAA